MRPQTGCKPVSSGSVPARSLTRAGPCVSYVGHHQSMNEKISFFLIAMSSLFHHDLRDGCLKRWMASFVLRNNLPLSFFYGNCPLSTGPCFGTLAACCTSFLSARLSPICRTRFCSFDCFSVIRIPQVPMILTAINCRTGPITVPSGITPRTVDPSSCPSREYSLQASVNPPKPSSLSACVL